MTKTKQKNRMSQVDIRAIVAELKREIIGLRLANIYDINQKTYMLKFAKPDHKVHLLIESGIRIHTTKFERDKNQMPSPFTIKLRKFIRTRRCESVEQLGVDRVVDFQFGQDEKAYHLIVEFFAKGNIILTDANYQILVLLRTHKKEETSASGSGAVFAVGETYPVSSRRQFSAMTQSFLTSLLKRCYSGGNNHNSTNNGAYGLSENHRDENERNDHEDDDDDENRDIVGDDQYDNNDDDDDDGDDSEMQNDSGADKKNQNQRQQQQQQQQQSKNKKQSSASSLSSSQSLTIKNVLNNSTDYGPGFTEHILLKAGIDPSLKLSQITDLKQLFTVDEHHAPGLKLIDQILKGYAEADRVIQFNRDDQVHRGYIILSEEKAVEHTPKATATPSASSSSSSDDQQQLSKQELLDMENREKEKQRERYEDFTPFLFQQYTSRPFIQIDTFDHAVDEFFSAIEAKKIDSQKSQMENSAFKKLTKVRKEQENRINELQEDVQRMEVLAQAIMQNLDLVDEAIAIVVSGASQYSWDEIDRVIKQQRKLGDPIASAISQLKLDQNQITMLLQEHDDDYYDYGGEEDDDSEDDSEEDSDSDTGSKSKKTKNSNKKKNDDKKKRAGRPIKVDIDISLTAYGNAQHYYSLRKKSVDKKEKTVAASHKAIKVAEKKTQDTIKKQSIKNDIKLMRKVFWFEKFNWFVTSENYLVLSGRDAQQNEILVKRYLRKGDVYIHADIHGASSCIVKNHAFNFATDSIEEQKTNIPAQTLHEAAMMTVCRSSAWDAKFIVNAYWVHANQVTKSAPTGEYLPTGSFMIRGKKNFLPPGQLVMGLAIMFRLDDESIANHIGERRRRDLNSVDDAISVVSMESGSTWDMSSTVSDLDGERALLDESLANDDGDGDADDVDDVDNDQVSSPRVVTTDASSAKAVTTEEDQQGEESNMHQQQQQEQSSVAAAAATTLEHRDAEKEEEEEANEEQQEHHHNAADEESHVIQTASEKKKKKGLSAKDKRKLKQLMKKGITENEAKEMLLNDDVPSELDDAGTVSSNTLSSSDINSSNSTGKKEHQQQHTVEQSAADLTHRPKGMKKGKWKKLKQYADQDEEERKLRLELIGQKYVTKDEKKKQLEEEEKQRQLELEKQRIENERKAKEKREVKQLMEQENIQYMDEEDLKKLSEIDSLTGQPREDDVILFAIPVCAPYISLKNYKYKVKILPGNMKRGKAGQQALNILIHEAKDCPKEQNLLKCISDVDTTAVMVGNCRIGTAASKAQKAYQSARKQKKGK